MPVEEMTEAADRSLEDVEETLEKLLTCIRECSQVILLFSEEDRRTVWNNLLDIGVNHFGIRFRKPNVHVYEEVLLEYGHPLHLADILEESLRRGVIFNGNQDYLIQLRNALASSKRFINMGENRWWVAQPMWDFIGSGHLDSYSVGADGFMHGRKVRFGHQSKVTGSDLIYT